MSFHRAAGVLQLNVGLPDGHKDQLRDWRGVAFEAARQESDAESEATASIDWYHLLSHMAS